MADKNVKEILEERIGEMAADKQAAKANSTEILRLAEALAWLYDSGQPHGSSSVRN